MALETGTYISDLVTTNPTSTDPKSQGDDHIRLLKDTITATFPNITGAVTPTHTELNYVDGVTSAIQTQLDAKAPLASPALTGTPTAPTASLSDNSTKIATTAYVDGTAFTTALPNQTGNSGKLVTTNGTSASWSTTINTDVVNLADGADATKLVTFELSGLTTATTRTLTVPDANLTIVGADTTQTLTNKTITVNDNAFTLQDNSDTTKKVVFELSGLTTSTTRTLTVADSNITLQTPGLVYLSTVTASTAATADIETTLDSTYDVYVIVATDVLPVTDGDSLECRLKVSGSYQSGANSYEYTYSQYSGTATQVSASSTSMRLFPDVDNNSAHKSGFIMYIYNPSASSVKPAFHWNGNFFDTTANPGAVMGAGFYGTAGAVTGVRFFFSASNLSGTFRLYGFRDS